jgi:N-acetylglucosaminyldiphosphoundecaprenol N-acetyl-beta-D-mannosaminyltransferase
MSREISLDRHVCLALSPWLQEGADALLRDRSLLRETLRCISVVNSTRDRNGLVEHLASQTTGYFVEFVNANLIYRAAKDPALFEAVRHSDLLIRDGVGTALACRAYGFPAGENMNGTDFITELLCALSPRRIALYGTTEPWLSRAADRIAGLGHHVVDREDGFREVGDYAHRVRVSSPEIIILGMGVPKQERVADFLRKSQSVDALILSGGAILDFLGGRFPRAPKAIRRLRLEWVHRLLYEPRRLLRRYTIELGAFLAWVAADAVRWRLWGPRGLTSGHLVPARGPDPGRARRESGDA